MELTRIGVIGHRGKLGKALLQFTGVSAIDCDITSLDSISNALGKEEYDCIINCAAYTNVDGAEKERLKAYNINSFGPKNLAKIYNGHIVHVSSDYIFDGLNGPYAEDDYTNPLSAYGFSKYFGEVGLRLWMDRVLVVRTTILYDRDSNNFVTMVAEQLKNNKAVRAPRTLIGNPTNVNHLAEGILDAVEKQLIGTINISGNTWLSRYEIAKEIGRYLVKTDKIKSFQVSDSPAWGEARRPEKAGFRLDRAIAEKIPLYSLWEGLEDIFSEPKKIEKIEEVVHDNAVLNIPITQLPIDITPINVVNKDE